MNEDFLRQLEKLRLALRRLAASSRPGDLPSRRAGSSVEFRSHRPYAPGDDFRTIDWNAYARLEELFVKEFAQERAPLVTLVLDGSRSMHFGGKFAFAVQVAQALAYVANSNNAVVRIGRREFTRPAEALEHLSSLRPAGEPFRETLRRMQAPERQLLVALSDFWDEGIVDDLRRLRTRVGDLAAIQILAPEELNPTVSGKVRLVDPESGHSKELYVGEQECAEYRRLLELHLAAFDRACRETEIRVARLASDTDLRAAFFVTIRDSGLLE